LQYVLLLVNSFDFPGAAFDWSGLLNRDYGVVFCDPDADVDGGTHARQGYALRFALPATLCFIRRRPALNATPTATATIIESVLRRSGI
jgi:hypothetical protein